MPELGHLLELLYRSRQAWRTVRLQGSAGRPTLAVEVSPRVLRWEHYGAAAPPGADEVRLLVDAALGPAPTEPPPVLA